MVTKNVHQKKTVEKETLVLPELSFKSHSQQTKADASKPCSNEMENKDHEELPSIHVKDQSEHPSHTTSEDPCTNLPPQMEEKDPVVQPKKVKAEEGSQQLPAIPKIRTTSVTPTAQTASVSPPELHVNVPPQIKTKKLSILQITQEQSRRKAEIEQKRQASLEAVRRSQRYPDVNIPNLSKRELTSDIMKRADMVDPIPFSYTDRKINVVRHAMYGNVLRKSTQKLQDDLRQTMRAYSTEKHQLLRQLADLRHEMDGLKASDRTISPSSSVGNSDVSKGSSRGNSRYFLAPNVAARKLQRKGKGEFKDSDVKNNLMESKPENKGMGHINSKQKVVPSKTSPGAYIDHKKSAEWSSGNVSNTSLPSVIPQKGIINAKALMESDFHIPLVSDSKREDISFEEGQNTNREKKKVHFSDVNKVTEIETVTLQSYYGDYDSPRSRKKGSKKGKEKGHLAPIRRPNDPREAQKVAAEYKALYLSIQDPIIRTRTLADILYAVRMRMQENENHLRVCDVPKPSNLDNTLCDFLLNSPREPKHKENALPPLDLSKTRKQYHGAPNNTATRIGRRSHTNQLQSYLRKMSKSRRMIEHMEAEQYRMAHIMGHEPLQKASEDMANMGVVS